MDTSEIYIKMSEKAWPDLKDKISIGSMLFSRRLRMLYVLDGEVVHWRERINTSNCGRAFPLLEQDQLQEMVFTVSPKTALDTFHLLAFMQFAYDEMDSVDSMEQLWLAFAMKEKHGKYWTDEGWKSRESH